MGYRAGNNGTEDLKLGTFCQLENTKFCLMVKFNKNYKFQKGMIGHVDG